MPKMVGRAMMPARKTNMEHFNSVLEWYGNRGKCHFWILPNGNVLSGYDHLVLLREFSARFVGGPRNFYDEAFGKGWIRGWFYANPIAFLTFNPELLSCEASKEIQVFCGFMDEISMEHATRLSEDPALNYIFRGSGAKARTFVKNLKVREE